jgi:hypothetical protein
MSGPQEVETLLVPHQFVSLADRRVRAIVREAMHDANVLQSIARSCYLQGLADGCQTAEKKARADD